MTIDEAIAALIAQAARHSGFHGAGAEGRGHETAGTRVSLTLEDAIFVVSESDWHESYGHKDRETTRRRTRAVPRVVLLVDRRWRARAAQAPEVDEGRETCGEGHMRDRLAVSGEIEWLRRAVGATSQ